MLQTLSKATMKPTITYQDFDKLDIRIGVVVSASMPQWSNKLLRLEMDFGGEIGTRVLFSGIRAWYAPDDLVGKRYPVIVNLAPKKMGEEESQGMMIMMDGESQPVLFNVDSSILPGTIVR